MISCQRLGTLINRNCQFRMASAADTHFKSSSSSGLEDPKNYYLKLSIDKKRQEYGCGKNFFTLKDVKVWSEVGKNVQKDPSVATDLHGSIYKPDPKLNAKIGLHYGNIAALEVDAIVNAANKFLLGGGGVDAVIHNAAGKYLLEECRTLNGCETGQAKITGGYRLPAKYVLHTVGPMNENPVLLESCYTQSLKLAVENNLKSIAFPCVSTGVYGYPNDKAAHVVLQTARIFLESNSDIDMIIFCLFLDKDKGLYQKLLPHYFPH